MVPSAGNEAVPIDTEMAGRGFKADVMDYVVRADPGPSGLTWNIDDWARMAAS